MNKIYETWPGYPALPGVEPDLVWLETSILAPWASNARKHSKKQLKQIGASISKFGFNNPVLIDEDKCILAGHGRVGAAKLLGWSRVPCRVISHLSEPQKRAYMLADNKLALNASWDEGLLAEELKALSEIDLDFDVEITGFDVAEIDLLIENHEPQEDHDPRADYLPMVSNERCSLGDVWQLGPHRLICGDSLDPAIVDLLMGKDQARMVFTDPPYNVKIDGHVGGKGKIKHNEFAMASGEMSTNELLRSYASPLRI